jgi:hypothetical protein
MKTISENNTIRYFESIGITINEINPSDKKTPDYVLVINDQTIYLEVKEISENDEEIIISKKIASSDPDASFYSPPIRKRFRSEISEANRQLKQKCGSNEPGITVIQDIRPWPTASVMPQEEIK